MTHKLKTETFSRKIERSGRVIVLPLTPLFSFVTFHLNVTAVLPNLLQTEANKRLSLFENPVS